MSSRHSAASFRSSIYNTPSMARTTKLTHTPDPFPMLDITEIVQCLESCSFICSEELIQKPTLQYMLTLLQQILDSFLNLSNEKFYKLITKLDDENEYIDTLNIVGFQKIIHKFLSECGIDDFNIMDIVKPEPNRVRRILSCIVNFARFREEHKPILRNLHLQNDDVIKVYKELYLKLEKLDLENKELKQFNESSNLSQINEINQHLEDELRKLKKKQESITSQHDIYKHEKSELLKQFEESSYKLLETEKELEDLRSVTRESPELFKQSVNELSKTFEFENSKLNQLELKSRNFSTSIESFNLLEQEIRNLIKIEEDIQKEINDKNTANSKQIKYKDALLTQQHSLQELSRKITITSRKIENNTEKIQRLKESHEEKKEVMNKKIELLHQKYATLITERDLNDQDLSSKKKQIMNLQNKINELKLQYENEVKRLDNEIMDLNDHIKIYVSELSKKI